MLQSQPVRAALAACSPQGVSRRAKDPGLQALFTTNWSFGQALQASDLAQPPQLVRQLVLGSLFDVACAQLQPAASQAFSGALSQLTTTAEQQLLGALEQACKAGVAAGGDAAKLQAMLECCKAQLLLKLDAGLHDVQQHAQALLSQLHNQAAGWYRELLTQRMLDTYRDWGGIKGVSRTVQR